MHVTIVAVLMPLLFAVLSFSHANAAAKWRTYLDPGKVFLIQYPEWLAPVRSILGEGLVVADASEQSLAKCSFSATADPNLKKQNAAEIIAALAKDPSIILSAQQRVIPTAQYVGSSQAKTLTGHPVFLLVYDYTYFYGGREIPMRGATASAVNIERGYGITLGCSDLRSHFAKERVAEIFQTLVVLPAGI